MTGPGLHLSQCFGEVDGVEDVNDADTLSACQFDETGQYLATGDKGGRIVIFNKAEETAYEPYAEFQSHESDFDYLKSLEIEERINQIQFLPPTNNAVFLLSTNDKTVKLWKVGERKIEFSGERDPSSLFPRRLPVSSATIVASPKRTYSNAHNYHINSISMNSDGETFVSADDLRINLWNHEIEGECFNIVDIKPPSMEDLTEVITSCQFHPTHCHMMIHSSSKGTIKLGDLRAKALVDGQSKVLQSPDPGADKSFFSEIIASISDARFSPDGRYIVSRDYMTLKLWDVNMESSPVLTIPLQQHLTSKFVQLYENDCIFDKFECCVSGDGMFVGSGSYDGVFKVFNASTGKIESKVRMSTMPEATEGSNFKFSEKVLHLSWSPNTDTLAVCGSNRLYIYNGIRDCKGSSLISPEARWEDEVDDSTLTTHTDVSSHMSKVIL